VSLIEVDGELVALPVVEARPRERGFYDFRGAATRPARRCSMRPPTCRPSRPQRRSASPSRRCELLGLRGPARIDLMLDSGRGVSGLLDGELGAGRYRRRVCCGSRAPRRAWLDEHDASLVRAAVS